MTEVSKIIIEETKKKGYQVNLANNGCHFPTLNTVITVFVLRLVFFTFVLLYIKVLA